GAAGMAGAEGAFGLRCPSSGLCGGYGGAQVANVERAEATGMGGVAGRRRGRRIMTHASLQLRRVESERRYRLFWARPDRPYRNLLLTWTDVGNRTTVSELQYPAERERRVVVTDAEGTVATTLHRDGLERLREVTHPD